MEYEWRHLLFRRNTPGEAHHWELYETCMRRRILGTLVRHTNTEWPVYDADGIPIAVLPKTLSFEEAKDAAKLLILLSLKQSEESS
jgi:hypothetical protein